MENSFDRCDRRSIGGNLRQSHGGVEQQSQQHMNNRNHHSSVRMEKVTNRTEFGEGSRGNYRQNERSTHAKSREPNGEHQKVRAPTRSRSRSRDREERSRFGNRPHENRGFSSRRGDGETEEINRAKTNGGRWNAIGSQSVNRDSDKERIRSREEDGRHHQGRREFHGNDRNNSVEREMESMKRRMRELEEMNQINERRIHQLESENADLVGRIQLQQQRLTALEALNMGNKIHGIEQRLLHLEERNHARIAASAATKRAKGSAIKGKAVKVANKSGSKKKATAGKVEKQKQCSRCKEIGHTIFSEQCPYSKTNVDKLLKLKENDPNVGSGVNEGENDFEDTSVLIRSAQKNLDDAFKELTQMWQSVNNELLERIQADDNGSEQDTDSVVDAKQNLPTNLEEKQVVKRIEKQKQTPPQQQRVAELRNKQHQRPSATFSCDNSRPIPTLKLKSPQNQSFEMPNKSATSRDMMADVVICDGQEFVMHIFS